MTEESKSKVLIVDDDKFLTDMYGMKFTAASYTVQTCLSVAEAIDALKNGFDPDAVVFDVIMPEQDGFAFLETVRSGKLAPRAALVALTNQSNDADKAKAESLGADRYIVKASMIPSEVVAAVGEEIAKKHRGMAK